MVSPIGKAYGHGQHEAARVDDPPLPPPPEPGPERSNAHRWRHSTPNVPAPPRATRGTTMTNEILERLRAIEAKLEAEIACFTGTPAIHELRAARIDGRVERCLLSPARASAVSSRFPADLQQHGSCRNARSCDDATIVLRERQRPNSSSSRNRPFSRSCQNSVVGVVLTPIITKETIDLADLSGRRPHYMYV